MRISHLALIAASFLATPAFAASGDKIVNIHPDAAITSKQGLPQFVGVSGKNSGAKGISMNKVIIPPGGSAKAHSHSDFESTIYVLKGRVQTFYGDDLKQSVISEAGDFIYIPPNVAHYPVNLSKTEEAIGIVARTDANEQEHVILHPGAK